VRIAVLNDVHGNVRALEAVLHEVDSVGADAIVLGGDVVAGPWPAETYALLDHVEHAVWIRGNADRELTGEGGRAPAELVDWTSSRLDRSILERLAGLPLTVSLEADGLGPVLFCHATPRNDTEIRTAISPDERWLEVLDDVEERTVVCGHTHVQFDRTVGDTRIVNAGSVGMPYENEPGAYWALLGPGVELRRTRYDVQGTLSAIVDLGMPTEWPRATADEATEYFETLAHD